MKRLHFLYRMDLSFESPVFDHYFVLRFVPETDSVQKIIVDSQYVDPPAGITEHTDGFGNRMFAGNIRENHSHFSYKVSGIAEVEQENRMRESLHPVFRYASPLTQPDEALQHFYRQVCPSEASGLQRAVSLMHSLYQNFSYVPGSTDVQTTAADAWKKGTGVCQDYAHILTALCRLDGIPARYVAGMMIGEGASHAWTEIYADGRWTALDPTNNCPVTNDYIKISHGRDYGDCAVDRGVFKGNTLQTQNVYVKVEEVW